ncbi:MAG: DUF4421 family protein [Bacteroidia bacterium]|nr:DUF4421 family protein [Bacteroidia bacterium]
MNIVKRIIFFGCWLLCAKISFALTKTDDTTFVQKIDKDYSLQLYSWSTNVDLLVLPDKTEKDFGVRLQPNEKTQAGLAVGFKYFTLAFGVQIPGTEKNEIDYGKTKFYDFSFGYFKRKFGGEIYYRYFQGMYSEQNDFSTGHIRQDMFLSNGGLNFYYAQNHKKYSMRAAISQQELQRKSAGSFVLLANVQFRNFLADSSIIAPIIDKEENYGELQGLKEISFITASLRPGYAHNFVLDNGRWFITPAAFMGIGSGWYTSLAKNGYKQGIPIDLTFHAKTFAGYNHSNWFLSVFYTYDGTVDTFKKSSMVLNTHTIGVNLGYRLQSIGIKWL